MAVLFISQTQRVSQTYLYLFVKLEGMPLKEGVLHVTNGRQTPVRDEILHKPGEMEFYHLGEKDCWELVAFQEDSQQYFSGLLSQGQSSFFGVCFWIWVLLKSQVHQS